MGMTNKQFQGFVRLTLAQIERALKESPDIKGYLSKYAGRWQLNPNNLLKKSVRSLNFRSLYTFIIRNIY